MTSTEPEPPGRVLIIDDDRMSQMVLTRNLRQAGYEVAAAGDGLAGLALLRASPFDLVILDFLMPGMDGYEVLSTIRGDEQLRAVPVVLVSGVDDTANAATLVEAGADDYLTKPIDSGLLRARASRCIEAKRLREREQRLHASLEANHAALRESERLREALTHLIVHDLRTPLTSLLASLRTVVALGDELPSAKRARLLGLAEAGGEALVWLINDLLDVYKLESGVMTLTLAPAPLAAVVARAIDQVAALAESSGVTVASSVADGPPVPCDANKLGRVLVNLLGNSLKATPSGGCVDVTGGGSTIRVTDTGRGIPADQLPRIFDKFFQVDGGAKGASGLGLTFCKLVVEAHGGTISVASEVGVGTTVTIDL